MAWLADATNASYIQGDGDARAAILEWSSLFRQFGQSSLPISVQVRRSPSAEQVTFSDFFCMEKNFCPPLKILIHSKEGTRAIRVRNIEALDRVDTGAFAPTHAQNDANIDSGASVTSIPMLPELHFGNPLPLIVFTVSIDGSRPLRFVLDTGGQNVLTPRAAEQLGIRTYGSVQVQGEGAGSASSSFAWVDRMQLGGATLRHQSFLVLPFSDILPDIDGIVGAELLSRFVTRIDFRSSTVELAQAAPQSWSFDAVETPIAFSDTAPTLAGAVGGITGIFTLDTGEAGSLVLNAPFSQSSGLLDRYRRNSASTLNGGGGSVQVTNVTLGQFELGRCSLYDVPATLAHAGGGASASTSIAGVVGQRLLRAFDSMVIDYASLKVWLGSSDFAACASRGG